MITNVRMNSFSGIFQFEEFDKTSKGRYSVYRNVLIKSDISDKIHREEKFEQCVFDKNTKQFSFERYNPADDQSKQFYCARLSEKELFPNGKLK